jgi:hypothetical protein
MQMPALLLFTAMLFFIACLAWLASVFVLAVVQVNQRRQYRARNLLTFMTVAALTMAMAFSLIDPV